MRLDEEFSIDQMPKNDRSYELVAPGWYPAVIKNAEVKATKDGRGRYIALRFDIIGETSAGRVVFTNINIRNANPKAEEIARQQLGEIMRATGITKVTDSDQLIGLQMQIKVDIRKSDKYDDSNEIKGYKTISQPSKMPAAKVEKTASSESESRPPWAK